MIPTEKRSNTACVGMACLIVRHGESPKQTKEARARRSPLLFNLLYLLEIGSVGDCGDGEYGELLLGG